MLVNLASLSNRSPVYLKLEHEVFTDLAKSIYKNFPKNIDILVYKLALLNGSQELSDRINNSFQSTLSSLEALYNYSLFFEDQLFKERKDIDLNVIKNGDELELIALGKFLKKDAVLLSTVTVQDKTRKIWDKNAKKILDKHIVLFQGNIFSVDNNSSMLRFSYYFIME